MTDIAAITSTFADSAGHWYTPDGSPAYTIVGKNGKERATTLRDARTMGLLPSVTTILKTAAAPGLEQWKRNNLLLSALTATRLEDEAEEAFITRIVRDADEQRKVAAERGTAIHGSIEKAIRGEQFQSDHAAFVEGTVSVVRGMFGDQNWQCERSFASTVYGYGGKLDLHAQDLVLDVKTKEFAPGTNKQLAWDDHLMQLSAYRVGMGMLDARCANVFVSVSHPGLVSIVEWKQDELERGWRMFRSLLSFWQEKNRYAPSR